jgi:hypothetical protein
MSVTLLFDMVPLTLIAAQTKLPTTPDNWIVSAGDETE